ADFDERAHRATAGLDVANAAGVHLELVAGGGVGLPAADAEAADRRDGGEGFAAEAHRADAEQVVGGFDLAGGVAGDGQREVVGVNAFAVVDDADELGAAVGDVDLDARREGVEAVLKELL